MKVLVFVCTWRPTTALSYCRTKSLSILFEFTYLSKYEFMLSPRPLSSYQQKRHHSNNMVSRTAASHTLFVANTSQGFYASHICLPTPLKLFNSITSNPSSIKFVEILISNQIALYMLCFMFIMPLTKQL